MNVRKYWTVWLTTSKLSLQSAFENRLAAGFFMAGKLIRFILFFIFLASIATQVTLIGGYDLHQMIIFFLVFNLFDLFGQIFFRGIYWFREQVVSGEFDFRMVKPMNALFQALTRETDILDVPMFVLVLVYLIRQPFHLTPAALVGFGLVFVAACLIITAIHIIVASLGVVTTEVDHTMMIYRDISAMARFPVDIYAPFVRFFLTLVIPVAFAYTIPAKVLMGLVRPEIGLLSLGVGLLIFYLSLRIWRRALNQYSSASS